MNAIVDDGGMPGVEGDAVSVVKFIPYIGRVRRVCKSLYIK